MRRSASLLLFLAALGACARKTPPAPRAAAAGGPVALFVGDSLTAGYGVDPEDAWPAVLDAEWRRSGSGWRARNAAVSGATSAGAAEQISWALTPDVRLVFICIGANDGLRGIAVSQTRENVDALIAGLRARGLRVALAGMKIPPNYGAARARDFEEIFPALARKHAVPFMPFLLEGVAAVAGLNQEDGLHPNVAGHKVVAANVAAFLEREGLLK